MATAPGQRSQGTRTIRGHQKPLGYVQIPAATIASTAVTLAAQVAAAGLTLDGVELVVIQVETAALRWRDDGTAPTTAIGMQVFTSSTFFYTGDFSKIQFIAGGTGTIVDISLYG